MSTNKFDVVIVGGGIAGLICANYLIKPGRKILLLEYNHQVGGLMGGFRRKGFYFDAGDQSFESGGLMLPLLQGLGLYKSENFKHTDYSMVMPQGRIKFIEKKQAIEDFATLFPQERTRIFSYFEEINRFFEPMEKLFWRPGEPFMSFGSLPRWQGMKEFGKALFGNLSLYRDGFRMSSAAHIDRHFPGYGLEAKVSRLGYRNMPMYMGMGLWHSWFADYWYPVNGQQGLMNQLAERFQRGGGEVLCQQEVKEILLEKHCAKGVRTDNNNLYYGDWIIFAGSMKRLYTEYLPQNELDPQWLDLMKTGQVAEPLISLYLGVDISTEELKKYLETHHTILFTEDMFKDYDKLDDPDLHLNSFQEISWPSRDNSNLAPAGKHSLIIQTSSAYRWMNNWGTGGDDFKRTAKYRELKKKVAQQMIETAGRVIPNLKDRIVYQELGSPLSIIHFTLNSEGSSAGWTMDMEKNVLKGQGKYLAFYTPIKRLMAIGQYSMWAGGVPFSALSGWIGAKLVENNGIINPLLTSWNLGKRLRK